MKTFESLRRLLHASADVFFPRHCIVCGVRLALDEQQLCAACLHQLPMVHFPSLEENQITDRFVGLFPIIHASSFFYYKKGSVVNKILFELKYQDNPQVGYVMGRYLARLVKGRRFFDDIDVILPVPLSRSRRWSRGYNQSEWIARGVASVTGLPIDVRSVVRVRNNPSQTRMGRLARMDNVQHLFAQTAAASSLCGKHVLVIDDVFTTGATILSLCETLSSLADIRFSILTLACTKT